MFVLSASSSVSVKSLEVKVAIRTSEVFERAVEIWLSVFFRLSMADKISLSDDSEFIELIKVIF